VDANSGQVLGWVGFGRPRITEIVKAGDLSFVGRGREIGDLVKLLRSEQLGI
jgi:hypothetical protein